MESLKSGLKSINTIHKKFNFDNNKNEELDEIIVENSQPSKTFMDAIMMLVNNSKQQLLSVKNIEESLHQQLKTSTKLEKDIKDIHEETVVRHRNFTQNKDQNEKIST